jgi:hypothetical protein
MARVRHLVAHMGKQALFEHEVVAGPRHSRDPRGMNADWEYRQLKVLKILDTTETTRPLSRKV